MLNPERLRELLDYDPLTGLFHWRVARSGRGAKGWFAGTVHGESGYLVICVDGVTYRAHRLAWMHVKGAWPRYTIDHKNGKTSDNRIDNLRDVSGRRNQHNHKKAREGITCCIEKRTYKKGDRYRARLSHFGKPMTIGTFDTETDAKAAIDEARRLLHTGYIPGESL